jgi:putative spermidine/putrescine transport system ATP-binding protein
VVRLACGHTVRVDHGVAGPGHLLLRPERVRLLSGENVPEGQNIVQGVLRDTLVSGGVVKHFVTLHDGSELLVQELANERRTTLAKGRLVRAFWPMDAGLFLNR